MKIKMREHFQGVGITALLFHENITVSMLERDEIYLVDGALGKWLIENGKADEILPPVYGSTPTPELRHDDVIYNAAFGKKDELASKPLPEISEDEPVIEKASKPKRSRK